MRPAPVGTGDLTDDLTDDPTDELVVGTSYEIVLVEDLTRTQIVQYAGASGDYNPLHTDEVYATQVAGYPSVFAHGMLTMGMTARVLTDLVGDGRLVRYGVRFVRQVWPGDRLTARAEVVSIAEDDSGPVAELTVVTTNQDGDAVLIGTAAARLDQEGSCVDRGRQGAPDPHKNAKAP